MVQDPQVFVSVNIAVDYADDPRLASALGARAAEVAAENGLTHHEPAGEINALSCTRDDADAEETSSAVEITLSGRKILDCTLTTKGGRVIIGKTVRFAVLSQRLDELETSTTPTTRGSPRRSARGRPRSTPSTG